jgi:hypothetical protein
MFKKLLYIIIAIIALYFLLKIPAIGEKFGYIKDDAIEKKDNIVNEYNKVKGEVTDFTNKVTETKNDVVETVDKVGEAVDKMGEAANKVGDVFGGDEEKTDTKVTCTEEEKAAEMCTMDYTPVCGDDGVTYGNKCQGCASKKIETYVPGECAAK